MTATGSNTLSGRKISTPSLTFAEKRVLSLVSFAMTNKEIASTLGISPATVKRHLENILKKLRLKNRVEAAIYGLMIDGCRGGRNPVCALEVWREERHDTGAIWAV